MISSNYNKQFYKAFEQKSLAHKNIQFLHFCLMNWRTPLYVYDVLCKNDPFLIMLFFFKLLIVSCWATL